MLRLSIAAILLSTALLPSNVTIIVIIVSCALLLNHIINLSAPLIAAIITTLCRITIVSTIIIAIGMIVL
jgi:hypothetical protein